MIIETLIAVFLFGIIPATGIYLVIVDFRRSRRRAFQQDAGGAENGDVEDD